MSLDAGATVAQYRLERRLGAGGMGEVFLARDTRLDRLVAIKVLVAPTDEQSRHRLLREARAVAGLEHHGICAIYEVGADPAGGDFIVMQYIEGETLAARLRRGRLRPDEALAVGAHVAEALMVAHHHGIVHRDLKPQNIIITPSGAPKLLDFGLATHVAGTKGAANAPTMSQMSGAEGGAGTPGYMAPEQIRNEPADFRTDVFALGCVLYECLTGRRAFLGATTAELMGQVLHIDPPVVSSIAPELGPPYDALCQRLLHKVAGERFQSAEEVLGAIRALTPSARFSNAASAPQAAPRRGSARWVAMAAGVLAIIAIVAWQWQRPVPLPTPPADAARLYERGVEAMRDGTYASARDAFEAAIKLFPAYPQAHSRLAEAHTALDDNVSAQAELLQVALVPRRYVLPPEDQLRFEAASEESLRNHPTAIDKYRQLANLKPNDAGRWLDLGRVLEAGARRAEARDSYEKAVSLDRAYAAARLRLGVLQIRLLQNEPGLVSMTEAIRLYRDVNNTEGEAEALLRQGVAFVTLSNLEPARAALARVLQLTAGGRYPAQRVQAQFQLARIAYRSGQFVEAEALASEAYDGATQARLQTIAAAGLIDIGVALLGRDVKAADAQFARAKALAAERGATRTEMRAELQQAAIRLQSNRYDDALALSTRPLAYFSTSNEARLTIEATLVKSRALEGLERYDEAITLTQEVLNTVKEDAQVATALDNLAGQLAGLGRLPEALASREQVDELHRRIGDKRALPRDLTNHAGFLIVMGRGRDAEALLREVDAGLAAGNQPFADCRQTVGMLRTLLAVTEGRWGAAVRAAAAVDAQAAKRPAGSAPDTSKPVMFSRVLAEYASARLGQSRTPAATLNAWAATQAAPAERRELRCWIAATLLARGEPAPAYAVAKEALAEPPAQANPEWAWRLAAIAASAGKGLRPPADGASMAALAKTKVAELTAAWGQAADAYFSRPDLKLLRDVR